MTDFKLKVIVEIGGRVLSETVTISETFKDLKPSLVFGMILLSLRGRNPSVLRGDRDKSRWTYEGPEP